jgi:hypothetical protein
MPSKAHTAFNAAFTAVASLSEEERAEYDALVSDPEAAKAARAAMAEPEVEAEPEPVTAAGRVRRMAARQGRPQPSPEAAADPNAPKTSLVATGGARGVVPGTELDRRGLANALTETLTALRSQVPQGAPGARGRDVIVASASWRDQYPPERRLDGQNEAHNTRIFDQALSQDALVATGGICAPVNVDWSVNMIATADRPLQAALPAFQAGRGGLLYRPDLDFSATSSGVGIWTEATDLSPAGATKPIYTVSCPDTEEVYVEAISTRLGFGNMMSRFDPETAAATVSAIQAAAARTAENNLLNLIAASCTQGVTSGKVLGATRDLLTTVAQCMAAYRNLHRIGDNQKVRAIFPDWVKDMIRVDMAREQAHAQDAWNSLTVTDEQIEDLFDAYGVSPIWHIDGQSTSAPGMSGAVDQFYGAQSASAAVQSFPTEVVWYLYYEGAFQYLDGGTLDLGVVRDSLLDATNDFELFQEVFESVAYRGFTGGALQLISTLCANGESGATATVSSCA